MKKWIVFLMCGMLLGLSAVAIAQEVGGETTPSSGTGGMFSSSWVSMAALFVVFGAIFYFMLIRPQRKRQAKMNELLSGLKRGDSVITAGGIHGEIDSIGEDSAVLVLEDGAKIKIAKPSIIRKVEK